MQSSLPHVSSSTSLTYGSNVSRIGSPVYPNQMYIPGKPTFKSNSFDGVTMRNSPLSVVNDDHFNQPQNLNLRKRSYEQSSPKSSIAGAVYNSSAVFKRLKASSQNSTSVETENTLQRSQGRPFSSNINSRFILHKDMSTLLQYMEKKDVKQLLAYDFQNLVDNGFHAKKEDEYSSGSTKVGSGNYKLDDLNVEMFKDANICQKLDRFMGCTGKSSRILSCDSGTEDPVQKQIVYDPPTDDDENIENRVPGGSPNSTSLSFILNSNKSKDLQAVSNGISAVNGQTTTYNNSTSSAATTPAAPSLPTNKYGPLNLHDIVGQNFECQDYQFVKAIRDSNGRILKLESIRPPMETLANGGTRYKYTTEWVKKTICYPRYKSKMKIHLLRSQENFILYNDLKMMLWDIQEEYRNFPGGELKFQMSNPMKLNGAGGVGADQYMIPILNDEIKLKLFKGKTVYVKIN
ncbi:unnamed protein product [Ambrosiozyma monospora]|uniref:Unnamed protein product n=1 Tax=Ambrosiozyma monospora TaxID=43982 RepID=A0ACB5T2G9_AMBMO|nr:unnamed protein product [Ambrosiozyma monospora]